MPQPGRKPNEGQPVRHRVKPVHQWLEVELRPYEGGPKLPKRQPNDHPWPAATKRWWQAISTMPHCTLWLESDWAFALDTAIVAAAFHGGDLKRAEELRKREKVLGTTLDARRDLRIRYVAPVEQTERASVTAIEDYKKTLGQ
jgi:hypothetical protein